MTEERLVAFGYPDTPRDPRIDECIHAFVALETEPARVEEWVARVAAYVLDGAPELAADAELSTMMLATVRDQWQTFVTTVLPAEASAQVPFQLLPSAAAVAVQAARRRIDINVLVAAYRAAQRGAWDYATGVVAGLPEELDHAALLIRFWSAAGAWFDAVLERSLLLHQEETLRVQQRGDAQRYDLVRRVLDGDVIEPRELSAGLGGYPVTGDHVAAILVADGADTISQLEAAAARIGQLLSGSRPLLIRPGGRELWCWIAGVDESSVVALGAGDFDGHGVRATLGGPYHGVEGFAAAYQDARRAQVVLGPGAPRILVYNDVAALAFLAQDPASEGWVRRTLGRLASEDPTVVRVRETLAAYIESRGSVADVAAALDLHKNTVRYRLDQAGKLLPSGPWGDTVDVGLAIRYYDTLLAGR